MFVIFEGLDKAGKTTLEWEFLKATNFKHVIIDRGPIGYKVFDELLGRTTADGDAGFLSLANKANESNDFVVVYCHCSDDTAKRRLIEHNHEELKYDYHEAQELLSRSVKQYYKNFIDVNTDKPIDECLSQIVEGCRR